jgi:signal transduction histidine kinase
MPRLDKADRAFRTRWRVAQDEVEVVGAGGDVRTMVLEQGMPSERAVRDALAEVRAAEERLMTERTARQTVMRRRVVAATTVSALVLALLFSAGAWQQLASVAAAYARTQQALHAEADALRGARAELERHAETLQAQVAERTSDLQRANAHLEAFAATISHDLRAPLRGLQGLSQALLEDAGARLDDRNREYVEAIEHEAAAMDRLITDLLEYSRLSRADLPRAAVSLGDALNSALHAVRDDITKRRARVAVQGPQPVVRANRAVLVQVFTNLLSNALKFSKGTPEIRVRIEEHDGTVRVWFEDNGIGVSPQHHERIFHAFERLHGTEAYPGSGIGLAIVREGVERLGGRVGLESEEGRGSRFWIELPQADAA